MPFRWLRCETSDANGSRPGWKVNDHCGHLVNLDGFECKVDDRAR
jgi:hypothetical protein